MQRVKVEMRREHIGFGVVRRMLHWAKIRYIVFCGDNNHAAGVLTRSAFYAGAAHGKPCFLRFIKCYIPLLEVLFYIAIAGFLCNGTDCTGFENVVLAKQLLRITVGIKLILAGEVEVDIRRFVAMKPRKVSNGMS